MAPLTAAPLAAVSRALSSQTPLPQTTKMQLCALPALPALPARSLQLTPRRKHSTSSTESTNSYPPPLPHLPLPSTVLTLADRIPCRSSARPPRLRLPALRHGRSHHRRLYTRSYSSPPPPPPPPPLLLPLLPLLLPAHKESQLTRGRQDPHAALRPRRYRGGPGGRAIRRDKGGRRQAFRGVCGNAKVTRLVFCVCVDWVVYIWE